MFQKDTSMTLSRSPRKIAFAALAAASAIALAACGSSSSPDAANTGSTGTPSFGDITLQYSWIKNEEFAGEYYADDNGYYTAAGFSKVNGVSGPSTGTAELVSGQAQIALSDAASIAAADAKGANLKIIGATFQKNPFTLLSTAEGTPLKTPQDLIGKKIGVDASNKSVFDAFLKANGLSESQMTIVPGQFNGPELLKDKKVDGYVSYITNEAIVVKDMGLTPVRLDFADNGLPYVAETYSVTSDYLAAHKDLLVAFMKAEIQGWSDVFKNPTTDTVSKVIDHFNAAVGDPNSAEAQNSSGTLDPNSTAEGVEGEKTLISTDETKANGLFTLSADTQAETIKSMVAAGYNVTADQLFDTSILDAVYAANPDLKNYGG